MESVGPGLRKMSQPKAKAGKKKMPPKDAQLTFKTNFSWTTILILILPLTVIPLLLLNLIPNPSPPLKP